jgi:hypothetical protein
MPDETTEVLTEGVIEIDADRIAAIIAETCHTSDTRAGQAANQVVRYLIDAFNEARTRQ